MPVDVPLMNKEIVLGPIIVLNFFRSVDDFLETRLIHLRKSLSFEALIVIPPKVGHNKTITLIEIFRLVTSLHHILLQNIYRPIKLKYIYFQI